MIKLAQFTASGSVSAQVVAQVSLVLHVAVCLLAMDVTLATTPAQIRLGRGGRAHVLGVAAGTLLYALHPMRAQVLSWSSCQPYVCAALFALLAVRCHLKRLRLRTAEADRYWSRRGLILGSATCLFYVCATLTKSAAVPTGAVIVFTSMLHSAGYLGCYLVSSGGSGTSSSNAGTATNTRTPLPPLRILPMQLNTVFMGLLGELPTVLIAVLTSILALRANLTTQGAAPPEQTSTHHHAHHAASGTTTPPPPLAFAAAPTTAALRRIVWPAMRSAYTVWFYLLRSVTSGAWGKEHGGGASPWYRAEPTLHATECTSSTQGPDIHQACQDLAAHQAAAYPLGVHIVAFAAAVGMTLWSFALLATPTIPPPPISLPAPPPPSSSLAAEAGKNRGPTATRKRTAAAADGSELVSSAALAPNHAAWVWCRRGVAVLWLLYGAVLAPTVGVFAHHGPSHQGLKGIAGIVGADRYMYFAGILGIPLLGFAATALELSLSPSSLAPRAAKASSSSKRTVGFIMAAAAAGFVAVTAWNARQGERGMQMDALHAVTMYVCALCICYYKHNSLKRVNPCCH